MHIYDEKKLKTKHVCSNDSGQFAKPGEDGAGIKPNENSVEHSSGKTPKGRDDLAGFSLR